MKFTKCYKVSDTDSDEVIGLAILDDNGNLWSLDREGRCFWLNQPLTNDFYGDTGREMIQMLEYEEVTHTEAINLSEIVPEVSSMWRRIRIRENSQRIEAAQVLRSGNR